MISDIHANPRALEAVVRSFEGEGVDRAISLGDVVGYNAFPGETVAALRALGAAGVRGNHDLMVLGEIPSSVCGPRGRRVVEWTRTVLSEADRDYLAALPSFLLPGGGTLCVHSSIDSPTVRLRTATHFLEERERIALRFPSVRVCFTGHTHEQLAVRVGRDGTVRLPGAVSVTTMGDGFWFINPGSVGEPRGADKRAAYAIFDTAAGTVAFRRVAYPRAAVLAENRRQGLVPAVPTGSWASRFRALVRSVGDRVRS